MLYVLHGPDDFSRAEKIALLRAGMGDAVVAEMNMAVLDGRTLRLSDLRQHTDSLPFLAAKRLIVVNGHLSALADKPEELQTLLAYLAQLPDTTDLVLVETESLPRRHPVLELAGAGGLHFAEPGKDNLLGWIVKRAKEHGAIIEPSAADLLGRLVGSDLRTLNSELEKLAVYVAGQRPITRADIDLLVPYTEDADQFGLSNAIGQRNARRAYDQLHKELDEGSNPMAILGSIAAQIRALIEVKDMAERGMSPAEIAQVKGWKSDYAATARLKEAANFSMPRLEQTLETLLEIDVAIKTGRMDSLLALDTLIARLCAR
jgi:DNA polymerase-3 subunit delta